MSTVSRIVAIVALAALAACGAPERETGAVLRIGHFPNVTHAQGLVAHALTRRGEGWFEGRLGPDVRVEWFVYNAGPSAMEAIFAGSLDMTYVGPSPSLNAYFKSGGAEPRVVSGAALGGSALVVHGDGSIRAPADFRGRKIATPQFGNTQDVECRAWLKSQGFEVTQLGGDVTVVPTANPDQLVLFRQGGVDAVWTVEPWVSILESEAGGQVFKEEGESITTILVARAAFLAERRDLARKISAAHAELTEWIQAHPAEAKSLVAGELQAETSREIRAEVLERAWGRLVFTTRVSLPPFEHFVGAAKSAGFLREEVDLTRLLEPLD